MVEESVYLRARISIEDDEEPAQVDLFDFHVDAVDWSSLKMSDLIWRADYEERVERMLLSRMMTIVLAEDAAADYLIPDEDSRLPDEDGEVGFDQVDDYVRLNDY